MSNFREERESPRDANVGLVATAMRAARQLTRENKSESQIALDLATERMLRVIAPNLAAEKDERGRTDSGASDVVAPVVVRSEWSSAATTVESSFLSASADSRDRSARIAPE